MVILLITAALIPSLIWLWFYLRQDPHPEPRRALVLAFVIGALVTIPAILAELPSLRIVDFFTQEGMNLAIIAFALYGSLVEELVKSISVFLFCRKSRVVDEPVDAMVYSIVVALGFAAAENALSLWRQDLSFSGEIPQFLLVRFISGTLLHALVGGIFGFGLAHWLFNLPNRFNWLLGSFLLAVILHAFWNAAILAALASLSVLLIPLLLVGFVVLWDFANLRLTQARKFISE